MISAHCVCMIYLIKELIAITKRNISLLIMLEDLFYSRLHFEIFYFTNRELHILRFHHLYKKFFSSDFFQLFCSRTF